MQSAPQLTNWPTVDQAQYRRQAQKPFYLLRLSVLEPKEYAGRAIYGRVYCNAKALWKLGWFLRDFLYASELLRPEEVDERALSGLRGRWIRPTANDLTAPDSERQIMWSIRTLLLRVGARSSKTRKGRSLRSETSFSVQT